MINELKSIVKNSTEEEVKSLLYQIFLQIQTTEEIEQYTEKQLVLDMKKTYKNYLKYKRNQAIII